MIKLIAIDMDGTLLNNKKQVAPTQRQALLDAMDAGVEVVLCTGRPLFGVLPIYKELNLGEKNRYIILNNGCAVYKTAGFELIDYFGLSREELAELAELNKGFNVDFTLTTEKHFYYVGEENEEPNEYSVMDSKVVFTTLTKINKKDALNIDEVVFKVMYIGASDDLDKLEESLSEEIKGKINFVRSQPYLLEAIPKKSSKSAGIEKLLAKMDEEIKREEIMTIGDAENDREMLQFAGLGVAMGNASDKIKKLAKYVTDTNENDGVAKAIEKFVLQK